MDLINPNFNIHIYKFLNPELIFNNDEEYIKHYINFGKDNGLLCCFSDLFINKEELKIILNELYPGLDDEYKVNIYLEKRELFDDLKNYIDDFDFNLFRKHINVAKVLDNDKILDLYFKNIDKIKNIYSEKIFYLKYPEFILDEYKLFNKKNMTDIQIYNYYNGLTNSQKNKIVISNADFYIKNPDFNDLLYDSDIYTFYNLNSEDKLNKIYSLESFFYNYPDFSVNIYKKFNNIKDEEDEIIVISNFLNNKSKNNIIYSINTFKNNNPDFDLDIYKFSNNLNNNYSDEELILQWFDDKNKNIEVFSINTFLLNFKDFNLNLYKSLNYQLKNYSEKELIIYWLKDSNSFNKENKVFSIKSFYDIYPYYKLDLSNSLDSNKIITYFKYDVYKKRNNGLIGRKYVSNINEVLVDLEQSKPNLRNGISLIIRAKNEELNIKQCIESVVDCVDEIIFVDNGSTDNTFLLMTEYEKKYNNIFLYKYDIKVSKVGIEHENALKNNDKNTLGTFYNWCLSKATRNIVFKWDADFICIRNNFNELVNLYNLKNRDDNIAIWFTGKTLFINNNSEYYINYQSFYNEYRIFSYKNGFQWYDGNICEYTEPYLQTLCPNQKFIYHYPLFYEMKRTTINEFEERSSMIDLRDINDYNIINKLKNEIKGCDSNLIKINEDLINLDKKIIIYTPSLSLGGGNQFILNIYYVLKTFGYKIIIVSMNYNNKDEIIGNSMYNKITKNDILSNEMCDEKFILNFKPNIIFLNSVIPFKNLEEFYRKIRIEDEAFTKLYFVSHSDVAYSNYFIEKYYKFFDKIIAVNNYTIDKLTKLLKFDETNRQKFFKIINYVEKGNYKKNIFKYNKKFGIISRFSEDKNIPMLLHALVSIFKKYPEYKCYLVGTHTLLYDNYLKIIIKNLNIENNICFEGFQNDTKKYYELFDFIILPSVSEGCSYNIVEALNYGIPVIATNVGGNHELIKNSDHGILLDYTGIRELEGEHVYIENYNEHLEKIGYFTNNKEFNDNYRLETNIFEKIFPFPSKLFIEVIPPIYVINKYNLDSYKDKLFQKTALWNENKNTLEWGILKMIESPYTHIYKYVRNNTNFIDTEFNENIYINQLIELFC